MESVCPKSNAANLLDSWKSQNVVLLLFVSKNNHFTSAGFPFPVLQWDNAIHSSKTFKRCQRDWTKPIFASSLWKYDKNLRNILRSTAKWKRRVPNEKGMLVSLMRPSARHNLMLSLPSLFSYFLVSQFLRLQTDKRNEFYGSQMLQILFLTLFFCRSYSSALEVVSPVHVVTRSGQRALVLRWGGGNETSFQQICGWEIVSERVEKAKTEAYHIQS